MERHHLGGIYYNVGQASRLSLTLFLTMETGGTPVLHSFKEPTGMSAFRFADSFPNR
jgi:hypothetical protein